MIYYETGLKELPQTCAECTVQFCNLPYKKNTNRWEIKKEYITKRHKDCPLRFKED